MSIFQSNRIPKILCLILLVMAPSVALAQPESGDIDKNGTVNYHDLELIAQQWLGTMSCYGLPNCADLNNDQVVDLDDYALVAKYWMVTSPPALVISEFMAGNTTTISTMVNGQETYPDWLEIYNPTDETINLLGWYLTDDLAELTQWPFPQVLLDPGDHLLVFASDKSASGNPDNFPFVDDNGYLHTNFKLSGKGENLALVAADGQTVVFAYDPKYPTQYDDISYGLSHDLSMMGFFVDPTPGQDNLVDPVLSFDASIVITELMYHPAHGEFEPEDPNQEYVEIYNQSPSEVDLSGWQFVDGVDFTFPEGTSIHSEDYLVIAADKPTFMSIHTEVDPAKVIDGWHGTSKLSNSGEKVELANAQGVLIDELTYYDNGDWAMRYLSPLDHSHRGWSWGNDQDGMGMSIELININLPNDVGTNWQASQTVGGTPGAQNSVYQASSAPLITNVKQSPKIPRLNEPVKITARIQDDQPAQPTVELYYRLDQSGFSIGEYPHFEASEYSVIPMTDDGLNADEQAGDGVYSVMLDDPAVLGVEKAVVEFFVKATDVDSNERTWPKPALVDGAPEQVVNCLFQVDDSFDPDAKWLPGSEPIYRLIMTESERARLAYIGSHSPDDDSDAQMNGTIIKQDGVGMTLRYNAGFRNRGAGSRNTQPNNYRINIPKDDDIDGVVGVNLNGRYSLEEVIGNAVYKTVGLVSQDVQFAQVRVNGENLAVNGYDMFGSYACVEVEDSAFVDNHFPDDNDGNYYRGIRRESDNGPHATLSYDGPVADETHYAWDYVKKTNSGAFDYTDLINLTRVLSEAETPDEEFVQAFTQVADVEQWLHYFATTSLIGDRETSLGTGYGDDYSIYAGINDPRFRIIVHDLDTILGVGDTSPDIQRDIFVAANRLTTINRVLRNPAFVQRYYQILHELATTVFSTEQISALLDNTLDDQKYNTIKQTMINFSQSRSAAVLAQIPTALTISVDNLSTQDGYYYTDQEYATIRGMANVLETGSVRVDGQLASWDPATGQWALDENTNADSTLLVSKGSVWKYLDDGTDLGSNWYQTVDDSAWLSGPAELGYGDSSDGRPEETMVGYVDTDPGTPEIERNYTTYFTHHFTVSDLSSFDRLALLILRDDGAVVYCNGQEIARSNMPEGTITFDTPAANNVFGTDVETRYYGGNVYLDDEDYRYIDPSCLLEGDNVLMVEVHNIVPSSPDISFDLELRAYAASDTSVVLTPGINRVKIQTYASTDGTGPALEEAFTDIYYDDGDEMEFSGTLLENVMLTAADGPWHITGDIVVPAGMTLTIEEGTTLFFDSGAGITVNGCLQAMGTEHSRICMTRPVGSTSDWDGIDFDGTLENNIIRHTDINYGDGTGHSIAVDYSRLLAEYVIWGGTSDTCIEMYHPSVHVYSCIFHGGTEVLHGEYIEGDEYLIVENNIFPYNTSGDDTIDFLGADWPGPVVQFLNNRFYGGGDDGIDLDGTDSYVEGNLFTNYHLNTSRTTTSNAIATGQPQTGESNRTDVVAIRNVFYDNDHSVLLKEDAFATMVNNVIVGSSIASIQLNEIGGTSVHGPGRGVYLDGNIYWDNVDMFQNRLPEHEITINNSIVPDDFLSLGTGNINVDPVFVDDNGDFHLRSTSPAIGSGPNGRDMGPYVPSGATVHGEPSEVSWQTNVTLTVDGPGMTHYKYRVNDGLWSDELALSSDPCVPSTIELADLVNGQSYTVYTVGKNWAGTWQAEENANASRTWIVDTSYTQLRINEVLARNTMAYQHEGAYSNIIELYYDAPAGSPLDLSDMSITDTQDIPRRFVIPSGTTINPGEYLVVFADTLTSLSGLHLGFALDGEGDAVYLYDSPANGGTLIDAVEFGLQLVDTSIGRVGHDNHWTLTMPTIGEANKSHPMGNRMKLKINEWLASGDVLFVDDFVELYNPSSSPVPLDGLFMTDDSIAQPSLHQFGPLNFIAANGYAVLKADGQKDSGHVNFKLSSEQEMIVLLDENLDIIDKVVYGPQTTDVSQGRSPDGSDRLNFFDIPTPAVANPASTVIVESVVLAEEIAPKYALVPTEDIGTDWRQNISYDTTGWHYTDVAPGGVGYETSSSGNYADYFSIDVESEMDDIQTSCYIRIPFNVDMDLSTVISMTLWVRYDDAFIAYVNGNEVARANFDDTLVWNAVASDDHSDSQAETLIPFDISAYVYSLSQGDNLLAIHAMNLENSSDFLNSAKLEVVTETYDNTDPLTDLRKVFNSLRITEMMYHPMSGVDAEFIELKNIGSIAIDLDNVRFVDGITYTFPSMTLDPNDTVLVVDDLALFEAYYDTTDMLIAGEYTGQLSNGGEDIVLTLPQPYDAAILRYTYDDAWYQLTDGSGYSLEIRDPYAHPKTWNSGDAWQQSVTIGGTPGQ